MQTDLSEGEHFYSVREIFGLVWDEVGFFSALVNG